MFLAQLDPEYWSFVPVPREMRPEYEAAVIPLVVSLAAFVVALIASAIIAGTVIARLEEKRRELKRTYAEECMRWSNLPAKRRIGNLSAQPVNHSVPYERKIRRINAWLATVVAITALATVITLVNSFLHGKTFKEEMNSEGETRSESLQSWLSETYSIEVNESTAEQISSGRDRAVRYDGETVVVKLAWVGAEKYMLVRYDSLSPVETER